jgi:UDP:flavonoid glycosyltransferase YjiC (YdhE family)
MRLLCTFTGGGGHLEPLVPIARAAVAAGHEVAFAGPATMTGEVERRGFAAFAAGGSEGTSPGPLVAPDEEREDRVLRDAYAGWVARERAGGVREAATGWRAEVILREEFDFGAAIAAERLGLPCAELAITATSTFLRPELLDGPLAAIGPRRRDLALTPFPAALRDPGDAVPLALRPVAAGDPDGAVYLTIGTVFGLESGDLLPRALAGLGELGRPVIVTVGRHLDPAALGPRPPHVRVERFVDQWEVLPGCAAVVFHGGSGTLLGALTHGLPTVLLPMGADQLHTARRCTAAGVSVALDVVNASPEMVRAAAAAVLADPGYAEAAGRMRDDLAGRPGPAHAVALLERLSG